MYPRNDEKEYQRTLNIDFAVKYWLNNGFKNKKINLGLANYGRTFKLVNANNNSLGAPANGIPNPGNVNYKYLNENSLFNL